jgi:hypothetical protein
VALAITRSCREQDTDEEQISPITAAAVADRPQGSFVQPIPTPFDRPSLPHCFMSRRRGMLVFAAALSWLLKEASGLGGAFSCFGFRCSRLLRFCPLAIAERPSDKGCVF